MYWMDITCIVDIVYPSKLYVQHSCIMVNVSSGFVKKICDSCHLCVCVCLIVNECMISRD